MSPEALALVEQLVAALAPLRQRTDALPFAIASENAAFTVALTKCQILAANAAIDAADRALSKKASE